MTNEELLVEVSKLLDEKLKPVNDKIAAIEFASEQFGEVAHETVDILNAMQDNMRGMKNIIGELHQIIRTTVVVVGAVAKIVDPTFTDVPAEVPSNVIHLFGEDVEEQKEAAETQPYSNPEQP